MPLHKAAPVAPQRRSYISVLSQVERGACAIAQNVHLSERMLKVQMYESCLM